MRKNISNFLNYFLKAVKQQVFSVIKKEIAPCTQRARLDFHLADTKISIL